MTWELHDDSDGLLPKATGTEAAMKSRYHAAIESGEILAMNAYLQDEAGAQYAWNQYTYEWEAL